MNPQRDLELKTTLFHVIHYDLHTHKLSLKIRIFVLDEFSWN